MPRKSNALGPGAKLLSPLLLALTLGLTLGPACRPKPQGAEPAPPAAASSITAPLPSALSNGSREPSKSAVSSAPPKVPLAGQRAALETDAKTDASSAESVAHRLLVIGDSLSDPAVGGGRYLGAILAACRGSSVVNLARGGFMVNQMRRRFEAEALARLPGDFTDLLVFGGVNDLYSDETAGRSVAKIQKDLSLMYAAAKRSGVRVIALTVAPWGGFSRYFTPRRAETTRELNAWLRSRRAAGEVDVVVDTYELLSCGDPERLCERYSPPFSDGLHFGPKGHARIAEHLLAEAFPDCSAPAAPSAPP